MYDDHHAPGALLHPPKSLDYSLTGDNTRIAIERGLAEADWYQSPVPRAKMRALLERKDGPAIRDTCILLAALLLTGGCTIALWGTAWAIIPYLMYAVLYGTSSDSRWHECSHGTAFKSDRLNNIVYEFASFMVMRESTLWRWSHTRHHSDTIIVGRDPEIQVSRPPNLLQHALSLVAIGAYRSHYASIIRHAAGMMTDDEKTFVPKSEFPKIYRTARIYLAIYLCIVASAVLLQTWIPIFLCLLPQFFGTWLMIVHNSTQHAGLAENVLDHRLNCRTVYMNPISRFIYWNMNYHVEHHMFPLVPYHALPQLHALIKDDCPPPYPSILSAWKEILPTVLRQVKEPEFFVKRTLPESKVIEQEGRYQTDMHPDSTGWLEICAAADLGIEDVIRFDHNKKTFALYRDHQGDLYATDGICTHGNTHLADGLVKGKIVECPKHNGRFNLKDGSPARAPICRGLVTYPIEERAGRIWLNIRQGDHHGASPDKSYLLKVVSNRHVSTFIKELVLEPVDLAEKVSFQPGDYLQIDIPAYDTIAYSDFVVPAPYDEVWRRHKLYSLKAHNLELGRRNNYSLASNGTTERQLKFNVRIATPPPGQDCATGVGSSYIFSLQPGDEVTAVGPFGDFHIKKSPKEMVYIGGGAGMAPLRSHITQLFENDQTERTVSFWYGARSQQEIFYDDYFAHLAEQNINFNFHIALSDPLDSDQWKGYRGFIHEVTYEHYLKDHPNPGAIEFYLCGPPMMIKACNKMLADLGVQENQIAYDAF